MDSLDEKHCTILTLAVVVLHCCTIVYYVFLFIGTERERSLFVMEIRKDRNE